MRTIFLSGGVNAKEMKQTLKGMKGICGSFRCVSTTKIINIVGWKVTIKRMGKLNGIGTCWQAIVA